MNRNIIETVLGAVVLLTAAVFLFFALQSSNIDKKEGYVVSADFDRIDGLKAGSDVRLNGVIVGSVVDIKLNTETYRATARFTIDPKIKLPVDTIASVASESLLGGKYLSLDLGVEDDLVATDGKGRLAHTTPPMRLDDLIGQLIYSKSNDKKGGGEPPPAQPGPLGAPEVVPGSPPAPVPGT